MTWRIFILTSLLLGIGSTLRAAERHPNIVIIFADDMGYGDPHCFNPDSKINTPNMDRLAEQGMRFTDAHAPAAWCTPSRYGLLTGHYPWRERRAYNVGVIPEGRENLATLLKRQGYRTAMIGKWHLGFIGGAIDRDFSTAMRSGPIDHGFDSFFGMHASLDIPPYYFIEGDRPVAVPTLMIGESHSPDVTSIQGAFWREGKIAPGFKHAEVLKTWEGKACSFIADQAKSSPDQPFFLYLALTAPHTPWLPDAPYQGTSKVGVYGDFVQEVDDVAGHVMEALDKAGATDNTLVILTSDNGPVWFPSDIAKYGHRAAGPLRGMKDDMWEGGHRMPFLACWPGHVPRGQVNDNLICFTDMLATFAAIVGEKLPANAGEDSINILPLLLGEKPASAPRQTLIIEGRVIRKGPWKLINGRAQGSLGKFSKDYANQPIEKDFLYNLHDDPMEERNVRKKHPEIVEELSQILQQQKGGKP